MIKPLVSVIVPVYNGEKFIVGALKSIFDQQYEPMEVIVVDDGSTDSTPKILESYGDKIIYRRQENQGPAAARNVALRLAKGEVIAFLDADDLWLPGRLLKMVNALIENKVQMVMGLVRWHALVLTETDKLMAPNFKDPLIYPLFGSVIFRRELLDIIGYLDASTRFAEDQDYFARIKEAKISVAKIQEEVLIYQRHEGNMTQGKGVAELGTAAMLRKALARRRAQGIDPAQMPTITDFINDTSKNIIPMEKGLVSVVVTVHNGEKFLAETLASATGQDYKHVEVIVVDDGSTDGSAEIVKGFSTIKYFFRQNAGVAAARNFGVKNSKGEYIAFLDQDDLWTPDKLSKQVALLESRPEVLVSLCLLKFFLSPGSGIPPWFKESLLDNPRPSYCPSATMARRSAFDIFGFFDETKWTTSDVDWLIRVQGHPSGMVHANEVLYHKRVHKEAQSSESRYHSELLRTLAEKLKRSR